MPETYRINGQNVTLDDSQRRELMTALLRETRFRLWNPQSSMFTQAYHNWTWHRNQSSPFHWVADALGDADLPAPSWADRLNRKHAKLSQKIKPAGLVGFFEGFGGWQREATLFRREMRFYRAEFYGGGARAERLLNLARDTSFVTLGILAAIATGGTSAAAYATTRTAAATMANNAAISFTVREMRAAATRVGRQMSGVPQPAEETLREIGDNAMSSISDAMLGEILNRFMRPLKDLVSAAATRELRAGRLGRTLAIDLANERLDAAITDAINALRPSDLRQVLREVPQMHTAGDCARSTARNLMNNRNFRRALEQNLDRQ